MTIISSNNNIEYAIKIQRNRRNITDANIVRRIELLDTYAYYFMQLIFRPLDLPISNP
jgi:hypothetical protein